MVTPRQRYSQHKSRANYQGVFFDISFEDWWAKWKPYWKLRGRWIMIQAVPGDGFVPSNVEIIPKSEAFRRTMDLHYIDRSYSP